METLNILLVEDNEFDILITQEILEPIRVLKTLNSVSTAEEAILYVNQAAPFATVEKPDLILLDLNLPKTNGFAVLVEVKSNPELMHIPVIILTYSTSANDKNYAVRNGADAYMEKPLEIGLIKSFLRERTQTNNLPRAI
jgi:CheY-like chemotaxis protein